jgi:hypothetical protein
MQHHLLCTPNSLSASGHQRHRQHGVLVLGMSYASLMIARVLKLPFLFVLRDDMWVSNLFASCKTRNKKRPFSHTQKKVFWRHLFIVAVSCVNSCPIRAPDSLQPYFAASLPAAGHVIMASLCSSFLSRLVCPRCAWRKSHFHDPLAGVRLTFVVRPCTSYVSYIRKGRATPSPKVTSHWLRSRLLPQPCKKAIFSGSGRRERREAWTIAQGASFESTKQRRAETSRDEQRRAETSRDEQRLPD